MVRRPSRCMCDECATLNSLQLLDLIGIPVVLNEPGHRLYRIVSTNETCLAAPAEGIPPAPGAGLPSLRARNSALAASGRAIASEGLFCVCPPA